MPFNPINFLNAPQQRQQDLVGDLVSSLMSGYQLGRIPGQLQEQRQQQDFARQQALAKMQMEQENDRYINQLREAQAIDLQSKNDPLYSYNKLMVSDVFRSLPKEQQGMLINRALTGPKFKTPEEIDLIKAQTKYYGRDMSKQGQGSIPADIRKQNDLYSELAKQNPGYTQEKLDNAFKNIVEGKKTLDDGTKINDGGRVNSLTGLVQKSQTYSPLVTQTIRNIQAEKEYNVVLDDMTKLNSVYDKSVGGVSFDKVADIATISSPLSSKESKKATIDRLAKYEAGQVLGYDANMLQQILVNNKTTVDATKAIRKHLESQLKDFGFGSIEVKNLANKYVAETIEKAYKARRSVSPSVQSAFKKEKKEENDEDVIPTRGPDGKWRIK